MFQNKFLFFQRLEPKLLGVFFVIEKLQTQVTMGRTALRRKEACVFRVFPCFFFPFWVVVVYERFFWKDFLPPYLGR